MLHVMLSNNKLLEINMFKLKGDNEALVFVTHYNAKETKEGV